MLYVFILFFIWIIYSSLEGKREAYYWHLWMNADADVKLMVYKNIKNIHKLFTFQRGVTGFILCLLFILLNNILTYDNSDLLRLIWMTVLFVFSLILSFSFFHNGFYYISRNNIDKKIYPKGFFDNSESSTSNIELSFIERSISFIVSLIFLFLICIL